MKNLIIPAILLVFISATCNTEKNKTYRTSNNTESKTEGSVAVYLTNQTRIVEAGYL